ncbi:MAG: type II toxin-antitoxin system VapC family toxin [Verrucomicrobiales bacterium]
MRVFFDTNIVLDQLDDRRDGHAGVVELEKCLNRHKAVVICSWHTLSIVEFVGAKAFGKTQIHSALRHLLKEYLVPETGSRHALEAFTFLHNDFEDALQISAAIAGGADYIVTNDKSGFKRSPVPVVTTDELVGVLEMR